MVNSSESAARARVCYSTGSLYSVPGRSPPGGEMLPVCSATIDELVPPFGAREFAVTHEGSTHLWLKTEGTSIVLEMLRPLSEASRVYTVDSKIEFGSEVTGR